MILKNTNKRIFNARKAQKKDKLGPLQNSQEFLALNRQQLQHSLSSMFIGHNVAYFLDVASSVNIESVGRATRCTWQLGDAVARDPHRGLRGGSGW